MWQLATAFAEIALRRRGPESLPDSMFLLGTLLFVYCLVSVLSLSIDGTLTGTYLMLFLSDTALALGFIFAVLSFFRLERRYRQTVCAIVGADIFINLCYLPVALAGVGFGIDLATPPGLWLPVAFFFWSVFIAATVLARSLSQPLIVGFMFEVLYLFISFSLVDLLTAGSEISTPTVS